MAGGRSAEEEHMTSYDGPSVGERGAVVWDAGGARATVAALVVGRHGRAVEVVFDQDPPPAAGAAVAVMVGMGVNQRVSNVRKSEQTGAAHTLHTDGRWRVGFDRRGARRYPVFLDCHLARKGKFTPGRCVDLSAAGAAIEAPNWQEGEFEIVVDEDGEEWRIPCRARRVEDLLGAVIVHASFRALPGEIRERIEATVAAARMEFEHAQTYLVGTGQYPRASALPRGRLSRPALSR